MIFTIAMIFIATGVAADNLALAFVSGKSMDMIIPINPKSVKGERFFREGLILFILLFIIQNMLLMYGSWFGGLLKGWLKGEQQLMATGLLFAMGIKMLKELSIKNKVITITIVSKMSFWEIGLGTAVYVFAFGCAVNWLNFNQREISLSLLALIICFLAAGILLGKYRHVKTFKFINSIAAFLVMGGSLLLFTELFIKNIK